MAIAKILAKLGLNITEWQTNLTKAQQQANTFASANLMQVKNAIAGAFTVGAIIAFTKRAADAAEQTINVSRALGVSTTAFQALSAAAKLSGASQEDVISMLQKLRKAQGAAAEGSKEMQKNFTNLGVSLDGIGTQDPAAVLEKIAKASQGAATDSQKFNDIIQILGRDSLPKMQAVLDDLAENGLTELEKKYRMVINTADELANLAQAKQQVEFGGQAVGSALTSFFGNAVGGYRRLWGMLSESTNRSLGLSSKTGDIGDQVTDDITGYSKNAPQSVGREERLRRKRAGSAAAYEEMMRGQRRSSSEEYDFMLEKEAEVSPGREDEKRKRRESAKRYEAMMKLQRGDFRDYERARTGEGISLGAPVAANDRARIGGTVGRQTDQNRQHAERIVKIMQNIKTVLDKIAERNTELKNT